MSTRFLVAKYVRDLRRMEPENVGVVLSHEGQVAAKFVGQREDGTIDGRLVGVGSLKTYKAWVHYWMTSVRSGKFDDLVASGRGPQNYLMQPGGEYMSSSPHVDLEDLLSHLYATLVEPTETVESMSVARLTTLLLNLLGISDRVQKDYAFTVPTEHGFEDEVVFDYRFDNGMVNLMHRVSLVFDDARSWDSVHATAWKFQKALSRPHGMAGTRVIALFKGRPADPDLRRQLGVLQEHSTVIDVGQRDAAAERLSDLLHLQGSPG
jgi:hypothetical protein